MPGLNFSWNINLFINGNEIVPDISVQFYNSTPVSLRTNHVKSLMFSDFTAVREGFPPAFYFSFIYIYICIFPLYV